MASPPLNGSPSVTEAVGGRDSRRVPGRTTSTEVKREQAILANMKDLKLAQNNIVLMLYGCGIITIKTPLCHMCISICKSIYWKDYWRHS